METLIKQIYQQARLLGACDRFTGKEKTLEELIALFKSPQGIEFCIKNHFPNITTFRNFKKYESVLQQNGIYVDAGAVALKNQKLVILVGRTSATCTYDELKRHEVVVLQGAKCTVGAWKWAVVHVQADSESEVIKTAYNNSVIL